MEKECYNCKHFNRLSDWMCVDYWLLIQETNQKGILKLGDEDSILKDFAKHGAGQGKVYSVCEKHKFILSDNRSDICNDFDPKEIEIDEYDKIMKCIEEIKQKIHGSWGGMTDNRRNKVIEKLNELKEI